MRRVLAVLASAALVVTGCGKPHDPEITFYSSGKTIRLSPTHYCDDVRGEQNCGQRGEPGTLKVRTGMPVQISVPGQLAKGRWVVAYKYIDNNTDTGTPQLVLRRSEDILGRGEDYAYTVKVAPEDQIVQVVVAEVAAVVMDNGELVPRGGWIVDVTA